MRKIFLFVLMFLSGLIVFSQSSKRVEYYSGLDKSKISTGILYDIAVPLSGIFNYSDGKNATVPGSLWKQIYSELYNATVSKKTLPTVFEIKDAYQQQVRSKVYPIALMDFSYNTISSDAVQKGLLTDKGGKLIETGKKGQIYETHSIFASGFLVKRTYTHKITFIYDPTFVFSNTKRNIKYLDVDFGDGKGYVRMYEGKKYTVNYNTDGIKDISLKVYFTDGTTATSKTILAVKDSGMPTPDIYWDNVSADEPYLGKKATADVAIFLGSGNTTLTNPVIVVDGFDPGDTRPVEGLYELANQQNMIDSLRGLGMDGVLINWHGGADYIQRNALLFVKIVDTINYIMKQNGTYRDDVEQIAVIGPSMGGLITRYGIQYMETRSEDDNIRVWVSFDSPQRGANVPLGLQHWVRFFADVAESEAAQEAKSALTVPAALQMLIYHFSATSGTTAAAAPAFNAFYSELNSFDFPHECHTVAIVNGSGYGNGQPYNAGDQVINFHYRSWKVDLDGNVWAVPAGEKGQIFNGLYDTALPLDETHDDVYVSNTLPYDNAPGGYINTFEEMDNIDPGYGDIIALYPNHSFIPVISSLNIQNFSDPLLNIDTHREEIITPFDKIYYPSENQFHVTITPESYWWFKTEIYNYAPVFTTKPNPIAIEDKKYTYAFDATDKNYWNTLSYEVVSKPSWLNYDAATRTLSGTPTNSQVGTYTVKIKVSDGLKDTYQTFDLTVLNVNDPPVANYDIQDFTVYAPSEYDFTLPDDLFTDVDAGDSYTLSLQMQDGSKVPDWIVLMQDYSAIQLRPDKSDIGIYPLQIVATDKSGATSTINFNLIVKSRSEATTAISEQNADLSVFPNPVIDYVNVSMSGYSEKIIDIYDVSGRHIKQIITTKQNIVVDLSGFKSGVYIVKVQDDGKILKQKIIKR